MSQNVTRFYILGTKLRLSFTFGFRSERLLQWHVCDMCHTCVWYVSPVCQTHILKCHTCSDVRVTCVTLVCDMCHTRVRFRFWCVTLTVTCERHVSHLDVACVTLSTKWRVSHFWQKCDLCQNPNPNVSHCDCVCDMCHTCVRFWFWHMSHFCHKCPGDTYSILGYSLYITILILVSTGYTIYITYIECI